MKRWWLFESQHLPSFFVCLYEYFYFYLYIRPPASQKSVEALYLEQAITRTATGDALQMKLFYFEFLIFSRGMTVI